MRKTLAPEERNASTDGSDYVERQAEQPPGRKAGTPGLSLTVA
jgi:hypothetical protein